MEEIFLWSGKELDTALGCEEDLWDNLEVTEIIWRNLEWLGRIEKGHSLE
jgi:hypothetical protein